MGYLDPLPEPWKFPTRSKARDNFEALQNLNHEEVTEDFADSPHADRSPKENEDDTLE